MKQYLNRIVRSIAHDVPKTVPRVPSISGIDLLVYGSRCPFAPVGSPCSSILQVSLGRFSDHFKRSLTISSYFVKFLFLAIIVARFVVVASA